MENWFSTAAEAMRRILIDNARHKKSERHGGNYQKVDLNDISLTKNNLPDNLLELDEALIRLKDHEPEVADIVKLRYFGGLTLDQAAKIKGISRRTAGRCWKFARLWLYREMHEL